MKIQYVNINEYKYRIEYIPYDECGDEKYSSEFVMLRNFTLINNIVTDNNIYFIESDVYDEYKESLRQRSENTSIVFPSNKNTMYYSSTYNIFNDTYIDNDILSDIVKYDILKKRNDDENNKIYFDKAKIKCDLVKIYHPINKTHQNLIIHIENIINNIHFHYLCKLNKYFYDHNLYNSYDEYRFENNIYSEYIKCYIPDVNELFDRKIIGINEYEYDLYFKEDMNIIDDVSNKNSNFLENTIIKITNNNVKSINTNEINSQYVPLALFTQPWGIEEFQQDINNNNIIEKEEKLFKKVYFKYHASVDNNYIITPINVSLYPYDELESSTNTYSLANDLLPVSCSFNEEYKFRLISLFDFDNYGNPSIIGYFDYPGKNYYETTYFDNALTEAYCFYHHVINRNVYASQDMKAEYMNELDEIRALNNIDDETIEFLIKNGDAAPNRKRSEYINILKEKRFESFLEEYIDEYKASIDFFGFRIEIASDKYFTHIIFDKNISIFDLQDVKNIVDENNNINIFKLLGSGLFTFDLHLRGLFTDWKQMPDMVVCRLTFIDRFIGNEIESNDIYITKEKFKYITNTSDFVRLKKLTEYNDNAMLEINLNHKDKDKLKSEFNEIVTNIDDFDFDTEPEQSRTMIEASDNDPEDSEYKLKRKLIRLKNKLVDWWENSAEREFTGDYHFINNISCIVNKNHNNLDSLTNNDISKNIQIVYKPIFFKTNQLNNVLIKYKQNQNIGIDLREYISKVDMFIMTIENTTYYEIGRNANYVIFNIAANILTEDSGTYEIYNDKHEYITYGSWSIIQ